VRLRVAKEASALRQRTEKQLSVLSVLGEMRAQPQHRRPWRAGLIALLLFVVPLPCGSARRAAHRGQAA
jgi:hypothetical protein